jgi:ABC-2 type transport system ATP-binding protein/lipopolysaccharide transport system ATP-binding protein
VTSLVLTGDHHFASEPAIVVEGVSKRFRLYSDRPTSLKERFVRLKGAVYEDFWALKDITLAIPEGSTFGLIGHNGSGKSTLLRLMAGIHRPTSGRVTVEGRVSALLELGAGFHPELTGRENIYLNGSILGLTRRDLSAKIDDIIEFAGLGQFIDSPVKLYSSGMFVRLGFAIAVHVNPRILLVDEVMAVGDEEFQRRCFDYLYRLKNDGATIVVVTHSLNIIQSMCDRAAWLDHGSLKAAGDAADVIHQYLEQVNAAEAERLEVGVGSTVGVDASPNGGSRHHGKPLTVDGVEFLQADGRPRLVAASNEPLTIRIHWTCHEPLEPPLLSFAIENETGVYVANPGMRPTHEPGSKLKGSGHADYVLPNLPLGPGDYTFTLAAHDHDGITVLDQRDRIATLRVQRGREVFAGLVDLLGTWSPLVDEGEQSPPSTRTA